MKVEPNCCDLKLAKWECCRIFLLTAAPEVSENFFVHNQCFLTALHSLILNMSKKTWDMSTICRIIFRWHFEWSWYIFSCKGYIGTRSRNILCDLIALSWVRKWKHPGLATWAINLQIYWKNFCFCRRQRLTHWFYRKSKGNSLLDGKSWKDTHTIHKNLKFKLRKYIDIANDTFKTFTNEILDPQSKICVLISIYLPKRSLYQLCWHTPVTQLIWRENFRKMRVLYQFRLTFLQ